MTPALLQEARQQIDQLLEAAGWLVQDASAAHIHAARGVAIREFPLPGYGFAFLSPESPPYLSQPLYLRISTNEQHDHR